MNSNWTTDPPIKDGFYWAQYYDSNYKIVISVVRVYNGFIYEMGRAGYIFCPENGTRYTYFSEEPIKMPRPKYNFGDKVSIKMNNKKERNGIFVEYEDVYMKVLMEDTKESERIIV